MAANRDLGNPTPTSFANFRNGKFHFTLNQDKSGCSQSNSLLRAGFFASTAARAVGATYMSNRLDEGNRIRRTDILINPAAGTPLGNNTGNQAGFFVSLFFLPLF